MAVRSDGLYKKLLDAGVFHEGDEIVRFVIDARVHDVVRLYVQRIGTVALEEILPQELRDLEHATQIFESHRELDNVEQIGEPETEKQSKERDAAGRDPDYVRRRGPQSTG